MVDRDASTGQRNACPSRLSHEGTCAAEELQRGGRLTTGLSGTSSTVSASADILCRPGSRNSGFRRPCASARAAGGGGVETRPAAVALRRAGRRGDYPCGRAGARLPDGRAAVSGHDSGGGMANLDEQAEAALALEDRE